MGRKRHPSDRAVSAPSGTTRFRTGAPLSAQGRHGLRRRQAVFAGIPPLMFRSPSPGKSAVEQKPRRGPVSSARPAGTCRTVAHAVAGAVADTPGVVRLQRTGTNALLGLASVVMDAPSRWGSPSRARVAACCGVRVRAVGNRAEVALGLCLDPSVVAAPDRLHAAVAVVASVEDRVASVVREAGWRCGGIDITVHALKEGSTGQGGCPSSSRPAAGVAGSDRTATIDAGAGPAGTGGSWGGLGQAVPAR